MSNISILIFTVITTLAFTACAPAKNEGPINSADIPQQSPEQKAPENIEKQVNLPTLQAGQKMARCVIGPDRFDGPCVFQSEPKGSFFISKRDQSTFYGDVSMISVNIVKTGEAEVFGLTTFGNNSRWGHAVRSEKDPACWRGDNFQVCAY